MSARDAILGALGPIGDARALAAEADALLAGNERPPPADVSLVDAFLDRLAQPSVGATWTVVSDPRTIPDAVAEYLRQQDAAPEVYLPPDAEMAGLDWSSLARLADCPIDGGAVVARAVAGVAETGTLVFDTGAHAPMLPNFLALHHIVILDRKAIVAWLEDIPLPPPTSSGLRPRTRYWVTGVSGTTDIEGQYVRGAHGPRFLHVLLTG